MDYARRGGESLATIASDLWACGWRADDARGWFPWCRSSVESAFLSTVIDRLEMLAVLDASLPLVA